MTYPSLFDIYGALVCVDAIIKFTEGDWLVVMMNGNIISESRQWTFGAQQPFLV